MTLDLLICFYKILSGQARQLLAYETYVSLEFYVEVFQLHKIYLIEVIVLSHLHIIRLMIMFISF